MKGHESVRVTCEYRYRDISAVIVENEHLRLVILDGKGGDVVEFRDKRTDVDVLWGTPHDWQAPERPYLAADDETAWEAHYPGGWQTNLPLAGWGGSVSGVDYGLHGESSLLEWDASVVTDTDERVVVELSTDLVRYPFHVERELEVRSGEPVVRFTDAVTNEGAVSLEYIWQQHVALGPPLVGPDARLDVPARRGYVEDSYRETDTFEHARLAAGAEFDWPHAPARSGGSVDLRRFPPYDSQIHDQVYLTDLSEHWYAVTNRELDLGFALTFPADPFDCLWYWQPFGGITDSPYFGRNYNVGLEPTTAHPASSIPRAQRANGSMEELAPGETIRAEFLARTYHGVEEVETVEPDGRVVQVG